MLIACHSAYSARLLLAAAFFATSAAHATLVCAEPEYVFGTQPETAIGTSHTFEVRNIGTNPVTLTAVRTSCDCLAATLTRQTVRPGERVPVDAHFTFRNESGAQYRAIHVAYRPKCEPETNPVQVCTLYMRGTILTPVIRSPNRLDLGSVLPGSIATGTVSLLSGRCCPFALGAVGMNAKDAYAEYVANVTGTNHLVRLLIPVPARSGAFDGFAIATTDLPEMPKVPIQYAGRSVPYLEIRPSVLAAPRKGYPLQARLTIASPYGADFHILSSSSTDPRVSVTVKQEGSNTVVNVSAEARTEAFDNALIRLTTDHLVCRMIEIPIRSMPAH
jgi:hypothetical protein